MKKRTIILLLVLAVIIAAGFFYFRSAKKSQPLSFITAEANQGYIAKTITATGSVQPVDTVSVGAQVSGVVKNVYVDFNSQVKQGQLLAKVDPAIINAQAEQARASLSYAQSNLAYQQNNYNRQKQLYELGAISKADYQLALSQYNSARATTAGAAAQLRLTERNLYYTNIYSPINGVVLNRNISEGQTIASSFNAPTLFVIAKDLTRMRVRAAVDEADIGGVRAGQPVNFTVDAFPEDVFEGVVEEILLHPSVSSNVVTYTTYISVDNKDLKLKPGMTASINIYLEADSNALLIPAKALNFRPDTALLKKYVIRRIGRKKKAESLSDQTVRRNFVWTRKGDTLIEKMIVTGLNDDTNVKVVQGLAPGELVITNVSSNGTKNGTSSAQRSPFMPQMRRRTTGGGGPRT